MRGRNRRRSCHTGNLHRRECRRFELHRFHLSPCRHDSVRFSQGHLRYSPLGIRSSSCNTSQEQLVLRQRRSVVNRSRAQPTESATYQLGAFCDPRHNPVNKFQLRNAFPKRNAHTTAPVLVQLLSRESDRNTDLYGIRPYLTIRLDPPTRSRLTNSLVSSAVLDLTLRTPSPSRSSGRCRPPWLWLGRRLGPGRS